MFLGSLSLYPHRCERWNSSLQLCHRSGSSLSTAWENMLRLTLESYLVDKKMTAPALVWDPLWAGYLFRHGSSFCIGGNLLCHGLSHGLQANLCSSAGSTSSPSFSSNLDVCRVVSFSFFSHFSASQLLCSIFYPFLNVRIYQHHLWSKLWTTWNPFWSHLASHRQHLLTTQC